MEINVVYGFLVVDFIHFASRRTIINHHVVGLTRESHPRVQDLQHPRLGKPRRGLLILDTRMGFPRPSRNVVIDSINLIFIVEIHWYLFIFIHYKINIYSIHPIRLWPTLRSSVTWTETLRVLPSVGRSSWRVSVPRRRSSHRNGRTRRPYRNSA